MKELIKRFSADGHISNSYGEKLEKWFGSAKSCPIRIFRPKFSCILEEHWEDLVTPGLEFSMDMESNDEFPSLYGTAELYSEKDTETPDLDLENADPASRVENVTDILYQVVFRKKEKYGDGVIATKIFKEKFRINKVNELDNFKGVKSILEEKRDVLVTENNESGADTTEFIGTPKLYIRSPILLTTLKAIISFQSKSEKTIEDKDIGTHGIESGIFLYPFIDLYHYKDRLVEYKNDTNNEIRLRHDRKYNDVCDKHIDVLIRYLYSQQTIGLEEAERLWNEPVPKTTFNSLWLLLKQSRCLRP